VPISAIVFGGRRARLAPLVFEARDWAHGVLVGASMASETTAAATGAGRRGAPRSDGDEALLRLQLRRLLRALAERRQASAKAAEDLPRQLVPQGRRRQVPVAGLRRQPARAQVDHRVSGKASAQETPIGLIPKPDALDLSNLKLSPGAIEKLLAIDIAGWKEETGRHQQFLDKFGDRMPVALRNQLAQLSANLDKA
jgi:phosphoenolpyruvate carboxykinase (GTP)